MFQDWSANSMGASRWLARPLVDLVVLGFLMSAGTVLAQPLNVAWSARYVGRTPTVQAGMSAENLGNGRYRVSVQATADEDWDAYIDYQVLNPAGDVYLVTGDFTPDWPVVMFPSKQTSPQSDLMWSELSRSSRYQ